MNCPVIREIDKFSQLIEVESSLRCTVVQGLDLRTFPLNWETTDCTGAIFLGCKLPQHISAARLIEKGALNFPRIPDLPYHPYRSELYTREELMKGWTTENDESIDKKIYDHFVQHKRHHADVLEALAQRIHDHAIDNALQDLLQGKYDEKVKKVVGIMGGHGAGRDDVHYRKIVYIARELTRQGYFIASGGGPGIMEAANLGAWLKNVSVEETEIAIKILAQSPYYYSEGYIEAAQTILEKYPEGGKSLAVPTWFYGHEPTNQFSSYIAKYFSNSIREDGLLAIAQHGVIFAPGSAGTTQEIFMDASQNHYGTYGFISPMVFLGKKRYEKDTLIYPCAKSLAKGHDYEDLLTCTDSQDDAIQFILKNPPKKRT